MNLRRRQPPLRALRIMTPVANVVLADGTLAFGAVGDWRIMNGGICLQILPAKAFPGPYEIVSEGTLTLSKGDRELIEDTAGIGATQSGVALISAVQRLAGISIGDVRIPFTPGQLEEIKHRATKRGITVERAIQDVVDRIKDELFHRG